MTGGEPSGRETAGAATGGVLTTLRVEGLVVFLSAVAAYGWLGASWLIFVLLFLAPDLAMLGSLVNARVGSVLYNLVHTYALPLALALFGLFGARPLALTLALIWVAHIGIDRALGYGLKYSTRFGDTHLVRFGR